MGSTFFVPTTLESRDSDVGKITHSIIHEIKKAQNPSLFKPLKKPQKKTRRSQLETNIDQLGAKMRNDNKTNINHIYKKMFIGRRSLSGELDKSLRIPRTGMNLNCSYDIKIDQVNKTAFNNTNILNTTNIHNDTDNSYNKISPFDIPERSKSLNKMNVFNFKPNNVNLNTSISIEDNILNNTNLNKTQLSNNIIISNDIEYDNEPIMEERISIQRTYTFFDVGNDNNHFHNGGDQYNQIDQNNKNNQNGGDHKYERIIDTDQYHKNWNNLDNLRSLYYSKLISKNIWEMKKQDYNSIFIFDWDDTLLCTTYITPNGYFSNNYRIKAIDIPVFKDLDKQAYVLLCLAIAKGTVFIVTNAVTGWVETSAKIFMPNVSTLLNKMTIISARNNFEGLYPNNSKKWKIETFQHIQRCFKSSLVTNLICLGDSSNEIEAAHIISKNFLVYYLKTIKFIERPKPEEMIKELTLVIKNFDFIYSSLKDLCINVEDRAKKKILKK